MLENSSVTRFQRKTMILNKLFYIPVIAFIGVYLFVPVIVDAGPILWSCDCYGYLGTVVADTGDVHVIGNMGDVMLDIAFDKNGDLFGIFDNRFCKIDTSTAAVTFVGYMGITPNSLVCDHLGIFYTANTLLYTVDSGTGSTRCIGHGGDSYSSDGDLAAGNGFLYLTSNFGGSNLIKINPHNGYGSRIGNIGIPVVFGLVCPNGKNLYGLSGTQVIQIDPFTGAGTSILDYSGRGLGISNGCAYYHEPESVPIPATVQLVISCLLTILIIVECNCQLLCIKVSDKK